MDLIYDFSGGFHEVRPANRLEGFEALSRHLMPKGTLPYCLYFARGFVDVHDLLEDALALARVLTLDSGDDA